MNYLTLDEIKKQSNIDLEYHGDDDFLEMIGDAAEDFVSAMLDCSFDELVADNGELPASIRHSLRMMTDYYYSQQRGSSSESIDIPSAVTQMLKLYRKFH